MPVNFVRRSFDRWLGQNVSRFRHPPIIVEQRKNYFIFCFRGITPRLRCFIGWIWRVEIHVMHDGDLWDILTDFDLAERRTAEGKYRCAFSIEPIDYASREALWICESFEPLLSWVNETLGEADRLLIYRQPGGGAKCGELLKEGEEPRELSDWIVATFRLVDPEKNSDRMHATSWHANLPK